MAERIKEPVNNGVAKVPAIMQLEALECGAVCLAMVLAYYDKWIPIEKVRADCGVSRDGSNAGNIANAARYYGLEPMPYSYELEDIKNYATFPCIIHWKFNHFVVLKGFKHNHAYINDPARGSRVVDMKTFDESFTGVCIEFVPKKDFEPSGEERKALSYIKGRLKNYTKTISLMAAIGAVLSVVQIMKTAMSGVFIDSLLSGNRPEWVKPYFTIMIIICLVQIVTSLINSLYSIIARGKIDVMGSSSFMWKMLHLPMEFFSQRMAGDIQQRQKSNASIAGTIVSTFAPFAVNSVMLILYLIVMVRYSWKLSLIGLTSLCLNIIITKIYYARRKNLTEVAINESAKLDSATVSGMEMIESIKANGAEKGFFTTWSGRYANAVGEEVELMKADLLFGTLAQFVISVGDILVLYLGVYMTIKGEFTLGGIMVFQGLLASFMNPARMFINAEGAIQWVSSQIIRVDDVMEYPSDEVFSKEEANEYYKLTGRLDVKNITFAYSKLDEPIIEDISFSLEPGKSVAIVGDSGSGKSTIARLLTGLYQPWSGEILYDGKQLNEISKSVFTGSVAMVDQEITLFEDTVSGNIKMWDESIEDFEMILAARDASIYDTIMERPKNFESYVREGGKNFSGGERQRIEIARVLSQDPTLIILDEATSALDARTEYDVVEAIKDRGISCVMIAHRLSTIRSCDEIIVLEDGHITGRGTHNELLKSCESYRQLIAKE